MKEQTFTAIKDGIELTLHLGDIVISDLVVLASPVQLKLRDMSAPHFFFYYDFFKKLDVIDLYTTPVLSNLDFLDVKYSGHVVSLNPMAYDLSFYGKFGVSRMEDQEVLDKSRKRAIETMEMVSKYIDPTRLKIPKRRIARRKDLSSIHLYFEVDTKREVMSLKHFDYLLDHPDDEFEDYL